MCLVDKGTLEILCVTVDLLNRLELQGMFLSEILKMNQLHMRVM